MKRISNEIAVMLLVSVFLLVPFSCVLFWLLDRFVMTGGMGMGKEAISSLT